MTRTRRNRSLYGALLISLIVHVCALLWYRALPKSTAAVVVPAEARLELDFIDVVAAVPEVKKVDPPAKKEAKPVVAEARRVEVEPPALESERTEDARSEESAESTPLKEHSKVVADASPVEDRAPTAVAEQTGTNTNADQAQESAVAKLMPNALPSDFVLPDPLPISRGKTIRNDPSELPDEDALRIAEELHVKGVVNKGIHDTLAIAKVESGGGSVYATELRNVLKKAAENPPPFDNRNSAVGRLFNQYRDGAARYGAGGSPYDSAASPYDNRSQSLAGKDQDPVRSRSATDAAAYGGLIQEQAKGAGFRAFADGSMSNGIAAVVELVQDPTAKLVSVQLIQSSGNPVFDKFVMELAPKSVDTMKPFAPGSHPNGLRTWWEFKGTISYTRSTKTMNLKDDGWYLAAMLPVGLLTGTFEETTGDVYVVDVRTPQYKCRVKLLRVYE